MVKSQTPMARLRLVRNKFSLLLRKITQYHVHSSGSDMNFDALRFVRFLNGDMAEGYEEPMWVTEREKLEAKREGRDCIDMYVLLP